MTALAFHFGAPDKLAYACRLLRKATASGARVLVVADAALRGRLDEQLWQTAPTDFITHCQVGASASASVLKRSAVLLCDVADPQLASSFPVLINLGDQVPAGFDAFTRLIEVVSLDDADRQRARQRWRRYTELGFDIERHDLALRP